MKNVVYILGAGFSAPLGLPVMSNFLLRAKDMFAENPTEFNFFESVFTTIGQMHIAKSYFDTDLFNIEEILSILEMNGFLMGEDKKYEFAKFIASVIDHFTPSIPGNPDLPTANWYQVLFGRHSLLNAYGCFLGNLVNLNLFNADGLLSAQSQPDAKANYQIITLNYDMVLENIWAHIRALTRRVQVQNPLRTLLIHKLHGSSDSVETIMPPTWNKMTGNLAKEVWKNAWKCLREANHIRIIGYSLPITDSYIRYLLKASILDIQNLKTIDVICLDENGDVENRYNDFIDFNFYRFRNGNVEEYLQNNFKLHLNKFQRDLSRSNEPRVIYEYLEDAHEAFMV